MTPSTIKYLKIAGLLAVVIASPLIAMALRPVDNQVVTGDQGKIAEGMSDNSGSGAATYEMMKASNPKNTKPDAEAAKPDAEAAKPDAEAAKPDAEAAKPDAEATKPDASVEEPKQP
ncbi:hypothetical protein P12x_000430 [Tundrisphaera lichenicola]|uniref:hypothetical protein n=1 Tax=Tundrisphaera lichenicola TaxID=2029860 RepID=UPI003EBACEC5